MPVFSTFFMVITLSSIALPLLNGFVGEFLILLGTFNSTLLPHARLFASLAALGMISQRSTCCGLSASRSAKCRNPSNLSSPDLNAREKLVLVPFALLALVMGVYRARSYPAPRKRFIDQSTHQPLGRTCNGSRQEHPGIEER